MPTSIQVLEDRPGLPELVLDHRGSRVRLSLQGAHITEYAPHGDNLLWMSRSARFGKGAAIRGGIPLCWPWFGASPDVPGRPQHGFARTALFELVAERSDAQHASVTLALAAQSEFPEWHGAARLEVELRLSDRLWMELRTTNLADRDLLVGAGLHSYFRVSDCHAVSIPALTGLDYLDKPEGYARKTQAAPLHIKGEIDRVYLQPPAVVDLVDQERPGKVAIAAWGHTDLVVWNPGPAAARAMDDFDDDGYRQMVCLEPALALHNRRRLAPGECFSVGQTIQWVPGDPVASAGTA